MGNDRQYQKKTVGVTSKPQTPTRAKSPVNQENELQGAIGNQEMGRLMETQRQNHPSSLNPKNPGEMPLLGGMMPNSQGRIQRQPLFRGLSEEMRLENATLALPESGAAVQRKLTLGTPGDMYEQEADRVARQVVDDIHSSPLREQNPQPEEERKPEVGEAGRVQRQITVRASGDAGGELSSEWEGEFQRAKSGGQRLSPTVKEPMERAFGADFGGVRVHTEAQADNLARSIQAKAFTTGQDVFFRQGEYEPGSRGGQELLAHELTHVLQQKEKHGKREKETGNDGIQRTKKLRREKAGIDREEKPIRRVKGEIVQLQTYMEYRQHTNRRATDEITDLQHTRESHGTTNRIIAAYESGFADLTSAKKQGGGCKHYVPYAMVRNAVKMRLTNHGTGQTVADVVRLVNTIPLHRADVAIWFQDNMGHYGRRPFAYDINAHPRQMVIGNTTSSGLEYQERDINKAVDDIIYNLANDPRNLYYWGSSSGDGGGTAIDKPRLGRRGCMAIRTHYNRMQLYQNWLKSFFGTLIL